MLKVACLFFSKPLNFFHMSAQCLKEHVKNAKLSPNSRKWILRHVNDPYVKMASIKNYRARSGFKLQEIDDKYKIIKNLHYNTHAKDIKSNIICQFNDFLQARNIVLDCGAAPGAWTQVILEKIESDDLVVSVDLDFMAPLNNENSIIHSLQNMKDPALLAKILHSLYNKFSCKLSPQNKDIDLPMPSKNRDHFGVSESFNSNNLLDSLDLRIFNSILSDMAPNATGIKSLDHEAIMGLCKTAFSLCQTSLKHNGNFVCKVWQGASTSSFMEELRAHFQTVNIFKPQASRDESSELYLVCKYYNASNHLH